MMLIPDNRSNTSIRVREGGMEVEVNDATTDLDSSLDSVGFLKVENSNEESEVSLISETDYESVADTNTSDDDLVIESLNGSDTDSNNSAAYGADDVNSPDNGESEANQDDDTNPNGGVTDNFDSALDSTTPTSSPDTVASADFTSTNTTTNPLPPTLPFLSSDFNLGYTFSSANNTGSSATTYGTNTESSDTDNAEGTVISSDTIDTDTNEPISITFSDTTNNLSLANSGLVTITSLLAPTIRSNNSAEYVTPTVPPDKANDQEQRVQEEESQSQSSQSIAGPAPAELRWLVDNELMQPSLALLWGESKTGKTFVALHYALNTALSLLPTSPSPSSITTTAGSNTTQQPLLCPCVIYVVGDDQRSVAFASIVRRVRAWCAEQEDTHSPGETSSFSLSLTHLAEHFFIWPGSVRSAGNTGEAGGQESSSNNQQHPQVFADQLRQAGLQPVLIVIDEPPQAQLRDRAKYPRPENELELELEIASWLDLEESFGACVLAVKNASPELNKTFPFFNTILTTTTTTTLNPTTLDGGSRDSTISPGGSSRGSSRQQELELHCQSQQEAAPFDPYQLRWGCGSDGAAGAGAAWVTESHSLSHSLSSSVLHLDRGNSFGKATPSSSSKKLTALVSKPEPEPASSSSTSVPDLNKPHSAKVKELAKPSAKITLSLLPAQPLVPGENESENEREDDSIISDTKSGASNDGADGVGNTNPLSVNSSEVVILQHLQQATLTPDGGLKSSELVGQVGSALSRRSVFRVLGNLKTKGLITKGEESDALYYISEAGMAELLLLTTANTTQAG